MSEPYVDPWLSTLDEDREETYLLSGPDSLDPLMERIGDARFVLLGEASHGTHEYYTWRTKISQRLIREKGFNFIAVEGDWPDCYRINRYVKGYGPAGEKAMEVLQAFERWPTWMWANWEIAALAEWLKEHNQGLQSNRKVGFYGLDVYSLWESMEALVNYLEKTDPLAASYAKEAVKCFEPYGEDWRRYVDSIRSFPGSCREEVIRLLREVRLKAPSYDMEPEASLNAEQNAHIAAGAENYYRSMVTFDDDSWNLRDTHMAATLNRLMAFQGGQAKAIVWEHNTHVGDARFTDMKKAGLVNVGQLVREQQGDASVVLVGFGSFRGEVIAGSSWGAPMKKMEVPEAKKGSVEAILHGEGVNDRLLIFDRHNKKERFRKTMPHRAIGVVYDPENERYGNYVPTVLNSRYDAFLYLDETRALHPLHLHPHGGETPDTYPFGV